MLHFFWVPCIRHVPVGEHVAGCMCTRVMMSVSVCSYAKGDGNSTVCAVVPRGTCLHSVCTQACLYACARGCCSWLVLVPFLPDTGLRIGESDSGCDNWTQEEGKPCPRVGWAVMTLYHWPFVVCPQRAVPHSEVCVRIARSLSFVERAPQR